MKKIRIERNKQTERLFNIIDQMDLRIKRISAISREKDKLNRKLKSMIDDLHEEVERVTNRNLRQESSEGKGYCWQFNLEEIKENEIVLEFNKDKRRESIIEKLGIS